MFHKKQKATKINWNDDIASVTTEKGDIFNADYVIIAVSLGVLKETHTSLFEPKLPHHKTEIIKKLGFGVMNFYVVIIMVQSISFLDQIATFSKTRL